MALARTVNIVKSKHVQTGFACSFVVDDEESKENLRKILQNKIGFMLKGRLFTWGLLLGQRRKQKSMHEIGGKCECDFYMHILSLEVVIIFCALYASSSVLLF